MLYGWMKVRIDLCDPDTFSGVVPSIYGDNYRKPPGCTHGVYTAPSRGSFHKRYICVRQYEYIFI